MVAARPPRTVLFLELVGEIFGGGQRSLLDMISGLDPAMWRPVVVCGEPGTLVDRLNALGVPVQVIPMPTLAKPWSATGRKAVAALSALMQQRRVALAHANQPRVAVYALRAARRLGIPVIFHARVVSSGGLLERWLDQLLMRQCRVIVAISEAVAARFDGMKGAAALRVIPNGVDTAVFRPAADRAAQRRALKLPEEGPLVGISGLLEPRKGHRVLFEAFQQVVIRHSKATLAVAGREAWGAFGFEEQLRQTVRQFQLMDRVRFLGFIEDVAGLLSALDVCVVPAVQPEGLGRTAIEAAACGCPVVATPLGGLREVVEADVTGLLVPPGDAKALARALLRVLDTPDLGRMLGAAARRRAEERFSRSAMLARLRALYDEVALGS
jgi:glycosyltransferase involved in cell wall biosynthesis